MHGWRCRSQSLLPTKRTPRYMFGLLQRQCHSVGLSTLHLPDHIKGKRFPEYPKLPGAPEQFLVSMVHSRWAVLKWSPP
ncbi:hypothetical protein TNIN_12081, partial [Trichonephila inaurata madagascariensis]